MTITSGTLEGIGDNISRVGLLFFAEDSVRVKVEVQECGRMREYTGRLARVQRINESSTGLAVEFDES